jgi:hypothetical protein
LIDPVPRVLASKIDKRKKPYNIKNKALPHCRKCGKFQQADRPYETYCCWCDSFELEDNTRIICKGEIHFKYFSTGV